MKSKLKQDRAWLLAVARTVAARLKLHSEGTRLRVHIPHRARTMDTDGWRAIIGDLGRDQPYLEVWFDRFSGYPQRKLYAGFRSDVRQQITSITTRVARNLWPIRVVTTSDTNKQEFLVLRERLARSEFNMPVLEKYQEGRTFYGIYDPTRRASEGMIPHFYARAVAFFEDVVRTLPHTPPEDEQREMYAREPRKRVASHLRRERSRLLATECKIRDDYTCQVCDLRFEDVYGKLGSEFAEAHHRVPLRRLRDNVRTRIEDLTTVCANCHRMLHYMEGNRDDVKKLRAIVRRYRQRT